MDYTIYSYGGIGPIQFGMTPPQVIATLGKPTKTFMKSPQPQVPINSYHELGCQVFYNDRGGCAAIQLFKPATPIYLNYRLLPATFNVSQAWFEAIDDDLQSYDNGIISFKHGITLYSSHYNPQLSLDCPVEAIVVFEQGYYDKITHILNKYRQRAPRLING
jgi:hypothetical protein